MNTTSSSGFYERATTPGSRLGRTVKIVIIRECPQITPGVKGARILRLGAIDTALVADDLAKAIIRYLRRRARGIVNDDQIPLLICLSADASDCVSEWSRPIVSHENNIDRR